MLATSQSDRRDDIQASSRVVASALRALLAPPTGVFASPRGGAVRSSLPDASLRSGSRVDRPDLHESPHAVEPREHDGDVPADLGNIAGRGRHLDRPEAAEVQAPVPRAASAASAST